jgi:hypothetical protein
MIEVTIKSGRKELGRIQIENVSESAEEFGDYSIQFGVDTGDGVAVYQRKVLHFNRKKHNVLGLIRIALDTLTEKELFLDSDPDASHSPNLARRLSGPLWPF